MNTKLITNLIAITTALSAVVNVAPSATAGNIKSRTQAPIEFQSMLQEFRSFVGEDGRFSDVGSQAKALNISNIKLTDDQDVKVYFIGETAGGYRNQLDFSATKGDRVVQNQTKIFGDTSCNSGDSQFLNFQLFCGNPNEALANTTQQDQPLNIGDFAEIGSFQAGTQLDFWLVANGINGGITNNNQKGIYGLDKAVNPDGINHVAAYYYKDYLVVGYEDLWGGGDKDYNDVVFAIDIGKNNARQIANVKVPEPTTTLGLFAVGIAGLVGTRRRAKIKN
ncbi:PEP-CTERM sorting domain-containing protein [Oscillatoriales cyanobacterium USR001]|nr:PEP-CTERM sorting domain-containing protein [Oscillatoriales cyanobacterium USR001]